MVNKILARSVDKPLSSFAFFFVLFAYFVVNRSS
jgi:hypothetical protein